MKGWSLLDVPSLRVAAGASLRRLTLPGVLARLSAGEAIEFPALRPHQVPAWHAFVVTLAYLALEAAQRGDAPVDEAQWRDLLRGLTPAYADDEPWKLVVDDWTRPAFLQSPCRPAAQADYRDPSPSVQELDLLVTSKNHDEKMSKIRAPVPDALDDWIFALVALQGFAGFGGRGNYGVMRMNGGFASRAQFRLTSARGAGAEFRRDLQVLLHAAESIWNDAGAVGIGTDDALALLWLEPWAGEALSLARVHPLCLEVCRRVRLRESGNALEALHAPSVTARVEAKDMKGLVGDPWTPVVVGDQPRAFTAHSASFDYARLAPVLFDDARYRLPLLARPTDDEVTGGHATLIAQVLVGGSGRTDGVIRREVELPTFVLRRFAGERGVLAERSALYVEMAAIAARALRLSLASFVEGREAKPASEAPAGGADPPAAVKSWDTRMQQRVDDAFFAHLFASFKPDGSDEQARRAWGAFLAAAARNLFDEAVAVLPSKDPSRWLSRAKAERELRHRLRKLTGEPAEPVAPGSTRQETSHHV